MILENPGRVPVGTKTIMKMKNLCSALLRTMFAVILVLAMAIAVMGQSASMLYDVGAKQAYPVVRQPIGMMHNVLGTKVNLEYSAFGGLDSAKLRPVAGVCLTYSGSLASNVSLEVGPAAIYRDGKFKGSGVFFGVTAKF